MGFGVGVGSQANPGGAQRGVEGSVQGSTSADMCVWMCL